MRDGVIIKTVINGMTVDRQTSDPVQQAVRDALIAFTAAMAESPQAAVTKEAQRVGIAAARAKGRTYRGRKPRFDRKRLQVVTAMLSDGAGASAIAKATGFSRQAVLRVRGGRIEAERALQVWGLWAAATRAGKIQ